MTKGEYCRSKGLHTSFPAFNPNDELDDDFKNAVDTLMDNFDDEVLDENGKPLEMCGTDDCEFNCCGYCCKENQKWDECPLRDEV